MPPRIQASLRFVFAALAPTLLAASCINTGTVSDDNDASGGSPDAGEERDGGEETGGGEGKTDPVVTPQTGGTTSDTPSMGGNSPVAPDPEPLGATCSDASQCQSGHCVDDVCCVSPCDGICQACGDDGLCDETPADDAACGEVSCPSGNNECLLYDSAITQNRCADFGVCKTDAECGVRPVDNGTACTLGDADNSVCLDGGCSRPVVTCENSPCQIDGVYLCCKRKNHSDLCTGTCNDTPLAEEDLHTIVYCDGHEDCRPGKRCTLLAAHVGRIECHTKTQENGAGFSRYELCASPSMPEQPCTNGGVCSDLFDHYFFRLEVLRAQLDGSSPE